MSPRLLLTLVLLAAGLTAGCMGSRWAIDDPNYRAKYPEHSNNVLQMAKQAIDARHVDGGGGWSVNGAAGGDPASVAASVEGFRYFRSWLEGHLGLGVLAHQDNRPGKDADAGIGLNGGVRVQSPARIAPFVGLGGFVGYRPTDGNHDGIDNDNDTFVDEGDENSSRLLGAIYSEVGVHAWLTRDVRLTGNAAYYVSTSPRDADFWMVGVGLSFFTPEVPVKDDWVPLERLPPVELDAPPVTPPMASQPPPPRVAAELPVVGEQHRQ